MESKKVKDILDIDSCHGKVILNWKFLDFCGKYHIDLHNLKEFSKRRKYAKYYDAIIREPLQGGYTYRIWENNYDTWYDEVYCNELSCNEIVFDNSNNQRDNFGTAIWYALTLADYLRLLDDVFLVLLSFYDKRDPNSSFDLGDCEDLFRVTFSHADISLLDGPNSYIEAQTYKDSPICRMLIIVNGT